MSHDPVRTRIEGAILAWFSLRVRSPLLRTGAFLLGLVGVLKVVVFDVDLYIEAQSKASASVFMGYSTLEQELSGETIFITGEAYLIRRIDDWFIKSSYADPDFKSSTPAE